MNYLKMGKHHQKSFKQLEELEKGWFNTTGYKSRRGI